MPDDAVTAPDQSEEMIEAVARAIYDATHGGIRNCWQWDQQWEDHQEAGRERYYKEARAALTAMQPLLAQGWQPIETAPRDGTFILAWCVHPYASSMTSPEDYVGPVIAWWIDHNGGGWVWHGHLGNFTHWRPLPAPPALDMQGERS